MREIAGAMGLTTGALYYRFRSKQELLYFCQDYSLEVLLREARGVVRLRIPAEEKVRRLVRAQVLCMLDELSGSAGHIEFHAMPRARLSRIIARRDAYEEMVRGVVEEGVRSGAFAPCDPKLVTLAILGAVNWTARWYRMGGERPPEAIAEAVGRGWTVDQRPGGSLLLEAPNGERVYTHKTPGQGRAVQNLRGELRRAERGRRRR